MEIKLIDNIMEYPQNTVKDLHELYGLSNPEVLNESINTLQNWINKQEHFVRKDFPRQHLEWTIITCKGSIERAKERLDKYCTAKVLNARMYEKLDVKNDFTNLHEFDMAILPKFSKDYSRVILVKLKKLNMLPDPFLDLFRYIIVLSEYARGQYLNGITIITDYSEVDMLELLRISNIPTLREFIDLGVNCFGIRVTGIYVITPSTTLSILMSIAKQVLSTKLASRLRVLKTFEQLHDFVSKDILPKDYGGDNDKTLAELSEMWRRQLSSEEVTQHVMKMQEFRTDESRRQLTVFNNEYMGTSGSFRKFVVD